MSDWTHGYVADIDYTHGYYNTLNPARIELAFLSAGLVPPKKINNACELGFGQGVSVNMHAAAMDTQWWGTDFNPAHAGFAQELAAVSESGAQLSDEAFEAFCTREDLPDFEFISLHGIWSWISDQNRQIIVDFISRKLTVGGAVLISYNTLPGWSGFAPMRHLLTEHAATFGDKGEGTASRVKEAIAFGDKLLGVNPKYLQVFSSAQTRLDKMKNQSPHYLAHEYFNRDWHPMYFADVARWFDSAKIQFATSANFLSTVDGINLTDEQIKLMNNVTDKMFLETTRDFMVNEQFRQDYWVKGRRNLTPYERDEALRGCALILATNRKDVPNKVGGSLGQRNLNEKIANPVLDYLSDHKIRTIGEVEAEVSIEGINFISLMHTILLLVGMGHLHPVSKNSNNAHTSAAKLNQHIMNTSRSRAEMPYLASPVSGGAIRMGRFSQMFLLASQSGLTKPKEWAEFTWDILDAQNQKLMLDGTVLDTPAKNLKELEKTAKAFKTETMPIIKALKLQ